VPRVLSALRAVQQIPVQIKKCPTAGPTIMGKDEQGIYQVFTNNDLERIYLVYTGYIAKNPGISTSRDYT
jgi:hypothetical protein